LLLLAPYAVVADGANADHAEEAVEFHASADTDGDGVVTKAELLAAAAARGITLTDEQVEAFLAADADGDGGVDLDEFLDSLDGTELGGFTEWCYERGC
jgi:Ca2+-binding EF-hand superfamily protein